MIAFDDDEKKLAEAQAAGIKTQDLRELDWSTIAALVLAPGVPLTHPAPHWTAALARKANVEIIGDIELFCRERAKSGSAMSAHRHHRHQRQIDHHRADRASASTAPAATPRWAAISACRCWRSSRSRPAASTCWRCRPIRSISRPRCKPRSAFCSTSRKTISTATAAWRIMPPSRSGWWRSVETGGTAVIGVDDDWTRAAADRIERAGKTSRARVGRRRRCATGSTPRAAASCAPPAARRSRWRNSPASAACAAQHNAQNAAPRIAACLALGLELPAIQKGLASFPGLAHRMQQVGPQGQRAVRQRLEGDQRRFRRQGAGELPRYFLDRRRQAEDRRHRRASPNSSRASARPI